MYGDDFSSPASNSSGGLFSKRRQRRIEKTRALVQDEYRRYESIKVQYNWKGKKHPFDLLSNSCVINGVTWDFDEKFAPYAVSEFVDECEERAKHHHEKQRRQEELRVAHSDLYGDLEKRVKQTLGGKFKYREKGVSVKLTACDEPEWDLDEFFGYNEYDKTLLEKEVILREQAHQERLAFIDAQKTGTSA